MFNSKKPVLGRHQYQTDRFLWMYGVLPYGGLSEYNAYDSILAILECQTQFVLGTVIAKFTVFADIKKVRTITGSNLRNTQVLKDFSGN